MVWTPCSSPAVFSPCPPMLAVLTLDRVCLGLVPCSFSPYTLSFCEAQFCKTHYNAEIFSLYILAWQSWECCFRNHIPGTGVNLVI